MTDLDTPAYVLDTQAVQKARAIVCCATYARDNEELLVFLQMLGLVDEQV